MTKLWVLLLLTAAAIDSLETEEKVGDLETLFYGVAGHVFAVNQTTLLVRNFNYTGNAPDAFFWVGRSGTPKMTNEETTRILAHPYTGQHYQYRDTDYPVLKRSMNTDVLLTLPPDLTVSDIRWLSVWCKAYQFNFGALQFRDDILVKVDKENESQDEDPEKPETESIVSSIIRNVLGHLFQF